MTMFKKKEIEAEIAKLSRDLMVFKMVNGMTGNERIDNLIQESKRHRHESALRLQEANNKYSDCCIKDLVNSLRVKEN